MLLKNRSSSNSGISNPLPQSDFFISEGDRLFGENFATGEYYRRKAENEKKKERYKVRQNQTMERERRRWERIDYEYLRKENQNMVNKEKNLVGRKNNPGMAFNPLNLQYDNSVQGEILKRRDEESKYRAWMRSLNIDKHSNAGYNIINGEERTILEERLNKDIVPDLIQKNMDQINEMKNKVFNKNTNFFTSVNRNNNSPQVGRYQYENNKGYMNMNRVNRSSTTPNMPNNMDMFNRNGGRFREPIQYRNNISNMNNNNVNLNNMDSMNYMNNNYNNNLENGNYIPQRNSNINNINNNNMNNNNYRNYNDNNGMTPPPQMPMSPQDMQLERNRMDRNNNYNINEANNIVNDNNNINNQKMNFTPNNMNNNINDNYGGNEEQMRNSPRNNVQIAGPAAYNNYGVNPYNLY
jgi:hypothetical protein